LVFAALEIIKGEKFNLCKFCGCQQGFITKNKEGKDLKSLEIARDYEKLGPLAFGIPYLYGSSIRYLQPPVLKR